MFQGSRTCVGRTRGKILTDIGKGMWVLDDWIKIKMGNDEARFTVTLWRGIGAAVIYCGKGFTKWRGIGAVIYCGTGSHSHNMGWHRCSHLLWYGLTQSQYGVASVQSPIVKRAHAKN
ncbi:hypothetical protein Btru_033342 [Bulinus truncatus]|nr:hypothetical protein Btru_033342 [Bulinus truncatus]